jgi:DnaJ like chaperone protein
MSDQLVYLKSGQRGAAIAKREESLSQKNINKGNSIQIAFTLYVIAIAAKLAIIGSSEKNIEEQIESFKEIFSIPDSQNDKIEGFYKDAVLDKIEATHYAHQLTNLFPSNRLLLEELIDDLFVFADADGPFTSEKVQFLKDIVLALKFNENYFGRVLRKHLIKSSSDPYELLSVASDVSYVDLKKSYRRAIRDCHPDKFSNDNVMAELKEIAEEQFNYYTQAYEAIKLKKGFNKKNNGKQ